MDGRSDACLSVTHKVSYMLKWWHPLPQGMTIPINNARPNTNLCYTKKEPIGVCGLVVPWNYPLMMLAWKMAPCLAAGNTVVIKPAEVSGVWVYTNWVCIE